MDATTVKLAEDYSHGQRNFQDSQLSSANLGWMNLAGADFRNADFYGATLSGANLKQANLSQKTNLAFADLSRADLTDADLRGANLEGANLENTLLKGAVYDDYTVFPQGFNPEAIGAISAKAKLESLLPEKKVSLALSTSAPENQPSLQQQALYKEVKSEAVNLKNIEQKVESQPIIKLTTGQSVNVYSWLKPWMIVLGLSIGIPLLASPFLLSRLQSTNSYQTSSEFEKPVSQNISPQQPQADSQNISNNTSSSSDFSADSSQLNSDTGNVFPNNRISQISEKEAVEVLENYLEAKKSIFGPSYNSELASQLTTNKVYEEILGLDGSLSRLKQNNGYYRYGEQHVNPMNFFEADDRHATIDVYITEDLTYYENNTVQKSSTNSQAYRFTLLLEDGRWKLSDRQKI